MIEAACAPNELWILERARHCCFAEVGGQEYKQRVLAFFGAALDEE